MRCVIGLGNPDKKYLSTRHNIGFVVLDSFAQKHNLTFTPSKRDYYKSEGSFGSSDFFLVKPTTYMNNSGIAVLDLINELSISPEDLLVIVDDVNLPTGSIRLRKSGSDGGHNGLKSIIYHLQSNNFARLRFGIGNTFGKGMMAHFVLNKFTGEEVEIIKNQLSTVEDLIEAFITGGYSQMLNKYSQISNSREAE